MNLNLTPEERAKQLLSKMNDEEKYSMLHGHGIPWIPLVSYGGHVKKIEKLKIPALNL